MILQDVPRAAVLAEVTLAGIIRDADLDVLSEHDKSVVVVAVKSAYAHAQKILAALNVTD